MVILVIIINFHLADCQYYFLYHRPQENETKTIYLLFQLRNVQVNNYHLDIKYVKVDNRPASVNEQTPTIIFSDATGYNIKKEAAIISENYIVLAFSTYISLNDKIDRIIK